MELDRFTQQATPFGTDVDLQVRAPGQGSLGSVGA
jgi:hypothetical protein